MSYKEYKRCSHHRSHEVSPAGCSSLRPHVKVSGIRLFAQIEHGIPGAGLGLTAAFSTVLQVLGWLRRGQGDDVPQRIGALHQLYLLFHPLTVVRSHEDGAHPRPHEERNLAAHQKQKQKQKRISTLLLAKIDIYKHFSVVKEDTQKKRMPLLTLSSTCFRVIAAKGGCRGSSPHPASGSQWPFTQGMPCVAL